MALYGASAVSPESGEAAAGEPEHPVAPRPAHGPSKDGRPALPQVRLRRRHDLAVDAPTLLIQPRADAAHLGRERAPLPAHFAEIAGSQQEALLDVGRGPLPGRHELLDEGGRGRLRPGLSGGERRDEAKHQCEREGDSNLAQALQLINGPFVNDRLRNPTNRISKLLAKKLSDQEMLDDLFLVALSRPPTAEERKVLA